MNRNAWPTFAGIHRLSQLDTENKDGEWLRFINSELKDWERDYIIENQDISFVQIFTDLYIRLNRAEELETYITQNSKLIMSSVVGIEGLLSKIYLNVGNIKNNVKLASLLIDLEQLAFKKLLVADTSIEDFLKKSTLLRVDENDTKKIVSIQSFPLYLFLIWRLAKDISVKIYGENGTNLKGVLIKDLYSSVFSIENMLKEKQLFQNIINAYKF